jgi:hypothetical protein
MELFTLAFGGDEFSRETFRLPVQPTTLRLNGPRMLLDKSGKTFLTYEFEVISDGVYRTDSADSEPVLYLTLSTPPGESTTDGQGTRVVVIDGEQNIIPVGRGVLYND